jgi:hypothetical protein
MAYHLGNTYYVDRLLPPSRGIVPNTLHVIRHSPTLPTLILLMAM